MTGQLDFVVFGPGRSGTTAFADAFNFHPQIFCAVEFLPAKSDHSVFRMPEDMLRLQLADMPHRTQSIEILKTKLSQGQVRFYGNKLPNYYLQLNRLLQELPNLKLFYVYRSPLEFVHSWDHRARTQDDRWHRGRLGVFGAIEQIFCLKRLASFPTPITMVSYRSLFFKDPLLMSCVVDRLGAAKAEFDQSRFEQLIFRQRDPKVLRTDFYDEFFSEFRFDLIDTYFESNPLSQSDVPEFAAVVAKQFARMPRPSRFASFLCKIDPIAQQFARAWWRQTRNRIDNQENAACRWLLTYAAQASRQCLGHFSALDDGA